MAEEVTEELKKDVESQRSDGPADVAEVEEIEYK